MALRLAVGFALLFQASSQILELEEGSACRSRQGGIGSCTLLKHCRYPGDFKREHPPICSFQGIEPIICCPKQVSEKLQLGWKASQYCIKYCGERRFKRAVQDGSPSGSNRIDGSQSPMSSGPPLRRLVTNGSPSLPRTHKHMITCDDLRLALNVENNIDTSTTTPGTTGSKKDPAIIQIYYVHNGRTSLPRTQKHMVLVGYGPPTDKEWGCGGSLITSRFVLSAAHCAKPELLGEARWARLGDLDISTDTDDASIQERVIVQRILHPGYKEPQVYNDIALFKLDQEVEFTAWVAPVCLHYENFIPSVNATVTGWGRVDFAGETSSKLLEADLDVFSDSRCRNLLPYRDNKTPRGIDSKLMLCAGKRDGSKDACSGDSGGPLVIYKPDQCLKTQIGITSFGSQCGLPDSPGVYTRVSAYITWIEGIVF